MELNQIKIALYKQKPTAKFKHIQEGVLTYETSLENGFKIQFEISVDEMGVTTFFNNMESQHLMRWIVI